MTNEQFCLGRSLNTDWIRTKVKHDSRQHHVGKSKNARAKSAASLRSASADFFIETDDEIDDTVKEFKLTLQLFKRLTQQVRDVNQCMNQQRIYSFKHHMNNEGIASPALHRSQLAAAMSKREIPATEAPYEPCNDLGPVCTYLTRPCSRQDRGTRVAPTSRPSSSAPPSRSSSPVLNTRPSSRSSTKRSAEKAADPKKVEEVEKADTEARKAWEATDPNFEQLFVPDQLAPEDMDFRFHDPYPETWVDEVVEDACFRGTKKADPFMHRLAELENLEEETVLWEKYREDKARQLAEAANSKAMINKNSKQIITMPQNSRTQSAKVTAPHLYRAKTVVNKLRTYSAVKSSASNGAISASDEGSDTVQTFRNSGYKMGVSFIPGSLYPEARPTGKLRNNAQNAKTSKNAENVSRNASPSAHTVKKRTPSKQPSCEACTRTIAGQKPAGGIPRAVALSANVLRNQYELKSTECYDIVELAKTFDPPCKAQFVEAKAKKVASSADAALIKGLSPGKSYFSQRRVSLTQLVPDESMTVRGIGARNVTRPSTGRCKSVKRGPKRR